MSHIQNEFNELALLAEQLDETGNYNVDLLLSGLKHMLTENNFFYGKLVNMYPEKDPSRVFYDLRVNLQIHQLAYVQLGGGYPKELRGPHWCYVLKNIGQKLTVIPATSVKENSGPAREPYEFDIQEDDGMIGRLHFDDMQSIDKMRVLETRPYKEVITPREEILEAYRRYLEM